MAVSADAEEAGRAEARRLEAGNPLWIVVFGVSSKEFVCFSRASAPFRAIVFAKDPDTLTPCLRAIENSALRTHGAQTAGMTSPARRNPIHPLRTETTVNDTLPALERTHLERLKLAADVLLSEHDAIPDSLEVELTLFRERVEQVLLLAASSNGEASA
jgi:hypothetical protein